MRDRTAALPDGRSLSYTELGGSSSPVVMYFHGAPSSRLDLAPFEADFAAFDVRVVSADRPGYGYSSPKPHRRREDWPSDVAALADQLGIERFAVIGASSGGPYAVVCAALLPDRVVSSGVVCGETDFGWPGAWDGFPDGEAALMRIGDDEEGTAWCEQRYGNDGSGFLQGGLGELAPADVAALDDQAFATGLMTSVGEAFRQGVGGYAQDVVAQGRPWAFDAGSIDTPVRIVHGEADTLTPVAHARHTAELIPTARLAILPDHGHISIFKTIPGLARDLVDAA